jgi:hypothetical protein
VGENEQPNNLPDLPEVPPAGVDPETFRQYQEFQRFQEFQQRYTQAPPPTAAPWTAEGGKLEPTHAVHEQLAGVRHQLKQIQDSQAKIEKVTNPPLWRKILRSTPVRWAVGILLLIIVGTVGVPLLIQHYFGSDSAAHTNGAGKPNSAGESGQLVGPLDSVVDVYVLPAEGQPPSRVCFMFSAAAKRDFAQTFGAPSCEGAISKIEPQITDRTAYAETSAANVPEPTGQSAVISSCDLIVSGGPRLGTFTVTKQDQGWEITGYAAQQPCPTATPTTTGPVAPAPTTTPGIPTEPGIPTNGDTGIPIG